MIVCANLDCEATWAEVALPAHVLRRISAAGALLAALADETPEIWTPAAVDPERLVGINATMRTGMPPRWDLAWADPEAKRFNDRRFALAIAEQLEIALPGARAVASLDELVLPPGPWVAKAVWTSAGRDRCMGTGPASGELATRLARLIARPGGVVIEPWMDRISDVGQCAEISAAGEVSLLPPHRLISDSRGGFTGIELGDPPLETKERDQLAAVAAHVGQVLARAGYHGPYTIDAFAYRDGSARRFHPLCELNARYTFGRIARALGGRALGFGLPPVGAKTLIAPAADDPFTAWSA